MSLTTYRHRLLHIELVGAVTVATFARPEILSIPAVDLIGQQFHSLIDETFGGQVVLNFCNVERLSTPLVGKVIEFHERLRSAGGRLVLCGISPHLYEIFELMQLPRMLTLCGTEQEALELLQPSL